jgi:hypothetical protein
MADKSESYILYVILLSKRKPFSKEVIENQTTTEE